MMLIALALAAAAPAADTPRGFVTRLYAGYSTADYSPFKRPERVFAPRLLAAIREDERLAQGEVGYLGGDPVCQCQDATGLQATITGVTPRGSASATVSVSISLHGYPPRPARLSLVRTRAGWRIADISSADEPSLLLGLQQSNKRK